MAALRQYVCNLYKELQSGSKGKFSMGFFETDDPVLQAQIESTNGFGPHIHYRDSLEEMERIGREREEQTQGERARKRKEFLAEMDAEAKAKSKEKAVERTKTRAAAEKQKEKKKLAAADRVL